MTQNRKGWLLNEEQKIDTGNQYSLETVVRELAPDDVEEETENIRLERVLFDKDDPSPIYRRAMRLVPEEEWKAKRNRYKQPPYLIMSFLKKDGYEDEIKTLLNQDLFLKESVDLRKYFSPIQETQKGMTCTAHAGKALMEYFQNRASNRNDRLLSWRFLYKVTRELMAIEAIEEPRKGDGGATLRDTLRSMVLFGVPPAHSDKNWLAIEDCDKNKEGVDPQNWLTLEESGSSTGTKQPSAFAYAYAQNFQASNYFRLDKLRERYNQGLLTIDNEETNPATKLKNDNEVGQLTVAQIRMSLAAGFPAIFGIKDASILGNKDDCEKSDIYDIHNKEKRTKRRGQIKIPSNYFEKSKILNSPNPPTKMIGHALVAVGYDDNLEFIYTDTSTKTPDSDNSTKTSDSATSAKTPNPDNSTKTSDSATSAKTSDSNESTKTFKGGFLFRDSLGASWGDKGYGWLPYDYVEKGWATDWWSLLNAEWINTSGFGIGTDQILGCSPNCPMENGRCTC